MNRTHKYYTEPQTFDTTNWTLYENSVYIRTGTTESDKIAAFDFENTLAWSDSGLIFMRTADDWVPTVNDNDLMTFFNGLYDDHWTIVIFTNQLENDRRFTEAALVRIDNFIRAIKLYIPRFSPYVFVAIRNDKYRKPNRGMWDLFTEYVVRTPSASSFYCGDAAGPISQNLLYQWSDFDAAFAKNCGLTFYTPDEMVGVYNPNFILDPKVHRAILIMAAHPSQYQNYINDLMKTYPEYVTSNLTDATGHLAQGRNVIIVGERFATNAGRYRATHFGLRVPGQGTIILMFTRPIKPFITDAEYTRDDLAIRGYANALDYHPSLVLLREYKQKEPYSVVRIN
ncbi:3 phosphatase [uncultured virus]|nr:3 phosphatase [uncultured virus]